MTHLRKYLLSGAWVALLLGAAVLSFLTRPEDSPSVHAPVPAAPTGLSTPPEPESPAASGGSRPEVQGAGSGSQGGDGAAPRAREAEASEDSGGFSVRALDGDGFTPLAGAKLLIAVRGGEREESLEATTDARGVAGAKGLQPGGRSIEVFLAGHLPARRAITIEAGRNVEVDVTLHPGAALAGKVIDAAGVPIPGAQIRLAFAGGAPALGPGDAPGPEGSSGVTGADGSFRLEGLRPGWWKVTAYAPGYRRRTLEAESSTEDVAIVLPLDPGFDVLVTDAGGQPVAGAHVRFVGRTGGTLGSARSAVTKGAGKVHLDGLPADPEAEVPVEVRHPGYRIARVSTRAALLEAAPLEVTLLRGGEVSGRVVDPEGAPIPGAQVRLSQEGGSEPPAVLSATSIGEFAFEKVLEGAYRITVTGAGRRGERTVMVEDGQASPALEIAAVEELPSAEATTESGVPPPRAGAIRGIIDLPEPPTGAYTVRVSGESLPGAVFLRHYRFSSGEPTFRVRNVPPGRYTVALLAGDRLVASAEGIEVSPGTESGPVRLRE